jgi:Uncharacterized protein conserved in archaea
MAPVQRNFLEHAFEISTRTVKQLVGDLEKKYIIIDPEVQRKLSSPRKKAIAQYIFRALSGESYGAFFAPVVGSKRQNGEIAILDGQHRFFGLLFAYEIIMERLDTLNKLALGGEGVKKKDARHFEGKDIHKEQEKHQQWLEIIGGSTLPIMAYLNLSKEQEQQLFHDTNNLGVKVAKSLALYFNHSDKFIGLTRWVNEYEVVKPLIQPMNEGTKLQPEYLFMFSTVYKAIATLFNKEDIKSVNDEQVLQDVQDFFDIVVGSLPDDVLTGEYIYRHAGTLPGIALFANRMRATKGVDWKKTLVDALGKVSMSQTNDMFVTIGKALRDENRKVTFSGSNGATAAVYKVLDALALRLDSEGNEVIEAYNEKQESEKIVIVSDEDAEKAVQEIANSDEGEIEINVTSTSNKTEEAIVNLIQSAEGNTLNKSTSEIAKDINSARSTVRDAIKRLKDKGIIEETEDKGLKLK